MPSGTIQRATLNGSTSARYTTARGALIWMVIAVDGTLLVYIMVDDLESACDKVVAAGGEIVERSKPDAREKFARFRDPAGNVLGLYQDR